MRPRDDQLGGVAGLCSIGALRKLDCFGGLALLIKDHRHQMECARVGFFFLEEGSKGCYGLGVVFGFDLLVCFEQPVSCGEWGSCCRL